MAKPLLSDELWEIIEPILPPPPARPKGGRPPVDDRKALTGILFVLKTGLPWEDLPWEMGCGCGIFTEDAVRAEAGAACQSVFRHSGPLSLFTRAVVR